MTRHWHWPCDHFFLLFYNSAISRCGSGAAQIEFQEAVPFGRDGCINVITILSQLIGLTDSKFWVVRERRKQGERGWFSRQSVMSISAFIRFEIFIYKGFTSNTKELYWLTLNYFSISYFSLTLSLSLYIYIYQVVLISRRSLTLFLQPYLSFIAPSRSSRVNPALTQSWCICLIAGQLSLVCPCLGVNSRTSLMSSSLLH